MGVTTVQVLNYVHIYKSNLELLASLAPLKKLADMEECLQTRKPQALFFCYVLNSNFWHTGYQNQIPIF